MEFAKRVEMYRGVRDVESGVRVRIRSAIASICSVKFNELGGIKCRYCSIA